MQPPQSPRNPQDPYSRTEVLGQAVMSIVQGMDVVQARALRMLAEHGISPLKPDAWYPMPAVLAAFQRIFELIGPITVRAIGRKVPESAPFPQDIRTLEDAMRSLETAYWMNHRGDRNIGHHHYEPVGPRQGRMVNDTPYPCDLDLGIIEAMADRFRPADALWVRIEHDPASCRKRGDRTCTYHLSW